jgi:GTP-binding protein LepA
MLKAENIRNFSIIAHIDHGKSTLADRLLEATGTVEKRKMRNQVLDQMELERERGITIKMQPVRMEHELDGERYILNLIDTPGHIDFSYEVSRALTAVEGVLLLVDATQGVQAQTLTTLGMAQDLGLKILTAVTKIDSPLARVDEVKLEVAEMVGVDPDDVIGVSGKTGEGVSELLDALVRTVPPPAASEPDAPSRSLVFDFEYSNHRGVIVYVRVLDGILRPSDTLEFKIAGESFRALEAGIFTPQETPRTELGAGEIGYIVTGIKEPGVASVGDTIVALGSAVPALSGYQLPRPVIWASIFPESQDDFTALRQALERLRLSDSSLSFEEESSGVLGRGFRCGFLGMLHLEIITERLRREFNLELVVTTPSITYEVTDAAGRVQNIYSPSLFPDHGEIKSIREQWVRLHLITPPEYIDVLMQIFYDHEVIVESTEVFGDGRAAFDARLPLRELMRNFFDDVKRVSSGYASLSYDIEDELQTADVVRLEVLINDEPVPAFSRIVSRRRVEEDARRLVERLAELLPRQLTKTKIQAQAVGRIIASESLSAMRKDVTGYLYGGDITRKMKLREKQKKGKKKMQAHAKADIPPEVFLKIMREQ